MPGPTPLPTDRFRVTGNGCALVWRSRQRVTGSACLFAWGSRQRVTGAGCFWKWANRVVGNACAFVWRSRPRVRGAGCLAGWASRQRARGDRCPAWWESQRLTTAGCQACQCPCPCCLPYAVRLDFGGFPVYAMPAYEAGSNAAPYPLSSPALSGTYSLGFVAGSNPFQWQYASTSTDYTAAVFTGLSGGTYPAGRLIRQAVGFYATCDAGGLSVSGSLTFEEYVARGTGGDLAVCNYQRGLSVGFGPVRAVPGCDGTAAAPATAWQAHLLFGAYTAACPTPGYWSYDYSATPGAASVSVRLTGGPCAALAMSSAPVAMMTAAAAAPPEPPPDKAAQAAAVAGTLPCPHRRELLQVAAGCCDAGGSVWRCANPGVTGRRADGGVVLTPQRGVELDDCQGCEFRPRAGG